MTLGILDAIYAVFCGINYTTTVYAICDKYIIYYYVFGVVKYLWTYAAFPPTPMDAAIFNQTTLLAIRVIQLLTQVENQAFVNVTTGFGF